MSEIVAKSNDSIVMSNIKLAQVLKRELKEETLASLEKKLKIPKTLISEWKQGRLPAGKSLKHLQTLSKYLGLTVEELLFDEGGPNKDIISSMTFQHNGNVYRINIEAILAKKKEREQ